MPEKEIIEDLPVTRPKVAEYQSATGSIVWWSCGTFAALLGFSRLAYGLLLPSIRTDLGGNYSTYGLVGTANFIGYLLGTLAVPVVLTRYGHKERLNIITLVAMCVAMLTTAFCGDLLQLSLVRFLTGLFSAFGTVLTMSLAMDRVIPARRGQASGLIWMGGSVGIVISGLIAPPIITSGSNLAWRLVWVAMSVLGLIAAVGTYRATMAHPAPPHPSQPASSGAHHTPAEKPTLAAIMAELLRPRGLLLLTLSYFGFGFGYIIYSTFFVTLLASQGMSTVYAGLVWAVFGAAGAAGAYIWGKLIDRWPNGFSMAAGLLTGAVGALSVLAGNFPVEIAGALMSGLSFLGPPLMVTVLLKRAVQPERYTASFSFLTAIFAMGQITGPLLGGVVVDGMGLTAAITTTAIVMGLAAVLAIAYGFLHKK